MDNINIFNDIFNFLKSPKMFGLKQFESKRSLAVYFVLLMFFLFVTQMCVGFIVKFLSFILSLEVDAPQADLADIKNKTGIFFYPFIFIIIPLIEETITRLGLSFKKYHVAISISVTFAFYLQIIRQPVFLPCILLLFLFFSFVVKDKHMVRFKSKYGNITIYIASLIFIFLHFVGWEDVGTSCVFSYSIAFITYAIGTIFLVFTRIRLGFFWVVLMHILHNFIPLCMALLES